MGDQFDFSLLIGSQYDGGPMEWDEQTLYVSTGTILNHVDINKVSKQDVMTARWHIFETPPKKILWNLPPTDIQKVMFYDFILRKVVQTAK